MSWDGGRGWGATQGQRPQLIARHAALEAGNRWDPGGTQGWFFCGFLRNGIGWGKGRTEGIKKGEEQRARDRKRPREMKMGRYRKSDTAARRQRGAQKERQDREERERHQESKTVRERQREGETEKDGRQNIRPESNRGQGHRWRD